MKKKKRKRFGGRGRGVYIGVPRLPQRPLHMRPSAGPATSQMEQARPGQRPAAMAVEGRRSGVMGQQVMPVMRVG